MHHLVLKPYGPVDDPHGNVRSITAASAGLNYISTVLNMRTKGMSIDKPPPLSGPCSLRNKNHALSLSPAYRLWLHPAVLRPSAVVPTVSVVTFSFYYNQTGASLP